MNCRICARPAPFADGVNHFDVLCGTFKTNLLFTTVYGFQFWGHKNLPFFGLDTVDGFDSWGHAKFMKESVKRCAVLSLKPESQFGIYIPEEAFVWGAKHECCWSSKNCTYSWP